MLYVYISGAEKSYPPTGGFSSTSATRQVRQQWFSVGIFPPGLHLGLTGNRPQSAPACSFLRWVQAKRRFLTHFR